MFFWAGPCPGLHLNLLRNPNVSALGCSENEYEDSLDRRWGPALLLFEMVVLACDLSKADKPSGSKVWA